MSQSCGSVLTGLPWTLGSCPVVTPLASGLCHLGTILPFFAVCSCASELAASSRVGAELITLTNEERGVVAEPLARDVTAAPVLRSACINRARPCSVVLHESRPAVFTGVPSVQTERSATPHAHAKQPGVGPFRKTMSSKCTTFLAQMLGLQDQEVSVLDDASTPGSASAKSSLSLFLHGLYVPKVPNQSVKAACPHTHDSNFRHH